MGSKQRKPNQPVVNVDEECRHRLGDELVNLIDSADIAVEVVTFQGSNGDEFTLKLTRNSARRLKKVLFGVSLVASGWIGFDRWVEPLLSQRSTMPPSVCEDQE